MISAAAILMIAAPHAFGEFRRAGLQNALLAIYLGIAVSGIAGPSGGTPEKPVGTVFIGLAGHGWQIVRRMLFAGDRAAVRAQTIETALDMMLTQLAAME